MFISKGNEINAIKKDGKQKIFKKKQVIVNNIRYLFSPLLHFYNVECLNEIPKDIAHLNCKICTKMIKGSLRAPQNFFNHLTEHKRLRNWLRAYEICVRFNGQNQPQTIQNLPNFNPYNFHDYHYGLFCFHFYRYLSFYKK